MQQHEAGRFAPRLALPLILNFTRAVVAAYLQAAHAALDGNARAPQFRHEAQAFAEIPGSCQKRRQVAQRRKIIGARLQYGGGFDAGAQELRRDQQEQRPRACDHHAAVRHDTGGLE